MSIGFAALLATLAAAVPARAEGTGVVTRVGTTIKVDFGDAVVQNSFFAQTGAKIELRENAGGTMIDSAADCDLVGSHVECTVSGATRLVVEMGPGPDFTEFFDIPLDVEIYGEAGDDLNLLGSARDDKIFGGPGADELDGLGGDDQLDGGEGDDLLQGQAESDDYRGGPGFDLVDFTGAPITVNVSLDDVPGDGPAGDNDNVHSDVEDVEGTSGNDVITGSALGNRLLGLGGDDTIDGGAGADTIDAGDGADHVNSRDGLAELVDCGTGVDTLVADDVDVTDGCENEQRSNLLQIDVDGDGAARPVDCDDSSAAIRPGAIDLLDDGIDQNCDGADATDLDRDRDGFPRPSTATTNIPRRTRAPASGAATASTRTATGAPSRSSWSRTGCRTRGPRRAR